MEENRKKKEQQAFSMFGQHIVYPLQVHDDISKFQEKNIDQLQNHQIKKIYNLDQLTIKKSSLKSKRQPKQLEKVQAQENLKQAGSWFGNYRIFPVEVKEENSKLEEKPSNQQPQNQITIQSQQPYENNKNQDQRSENFIRFRNNFVQSNEISTQSSSKIGKYLKCVLASVVTLAILLILGLLAFLLVHFLTPHDNDPQQPRPSNFHNVQPIKQSPYILLPDYQKDQVYHINYTIISTMSEDYKVRVNYTVYFVSAKIQQENGERIQTNFQASMQKRSQEKIARDDTIEDVQFFDNSTFYNQILKNGLGNLQGQENSTDQSENITCQQLQSYSNQQIICNQPLLWVFNFSLLANGKIKELTYPFKIKKEELGLLRTFIKMFSPFLDKKAYESAQPRQQIKKLQQNPVLSDDNQSGNSYKQISQYQEEKSQDNVTLKENTEVNVQSDTQNTQQTATQQTIFQAGKPSTGVLQSQVSFLPKMEENQASDNLFNPKPTELNLNFTSNQQCYFQVIQIFTTNHLEEFSGILANYKEENKTKTTDVQGLIDFILQGKAQTQGSQMAPGTTRILLEEDGSLKIIGYDKKVTLVKTNVIGFSIAAYGYFQLDIKMHQDQINSLKKNIVFNSDVGTILSLGSTHFKYSLYYYRKQLAALNLKFTLEQIQFAYDLLKGGFIVKLIQLKKVIFSGRLEDDLLPKIGQILSVVTNLTTIIDYQANLNSPLSKLNQIYSVIQIVWETYQTKGLSLLDKDKQTVKILSSGLLQYVNISYEQALNVFQESKGKLDQIKSNSNTLFLNILDTFLNQTVKQTQTQIINMISQQIYDEYNSEIQKVKIIFEMIDYYKAEGQKYSNSITEIIEKHKQNLLEAVKNVLDLYFENQTTIVQSIEGEFLQYYQKQKYSYQTYEPKLKNISYFVTKNSLELFNSVLNTNLGLQQYQSNFTNLFTSLANYANGARSQRFIGCCSQYRTWYGKLVCRYYNDGDPYQNNIPTIWNATNKITNESIIYATIAAQSFVRNITKLLQENFTVQQKFMKLQIAYYDSIGRYPLNKTLIFDALSKCKSQAQNALRNVRCGNTNNLKTFIDMIGSLQSAFQSYYQQYDYLNQTIFRVFDQFNTTIFTNITTYAKLTVSTIQFMKNYQEQVQRVKNNFLELQKKAKNFSPQIFIKNNELATQIFGLYQYAINKVDQICKKGPSTILQINSIRQQYKSADKMLSQLSSSFFSTQLTELTTMINSMSINVFKEYQNTPFCQLRQSFYNNLSILYPDFQNFTILYRLWQNFNQIKTESKQKIANFLNFGYSLEGLFYQMFSPEGYNNFIKNINKQSYQFIKQTQNLGMKFSHLKQQSKNILIYKTATENQLKNAYNSFLNLQFSLDTSKMFDSINQLTQQSFQAIKNLSFDVITVVVSSKNIKQYFGQTVQNYKNGIYKISQEFKNICQIFIHLDKIASQSYLNEIDQKFKSIMNIINQTIFPNVSAGFETIKSKYANYTFTNQKMNQVFTNNIDILINYTQLMDQEKKQLNEKFYQIYSEASQLINSLQIGSLNSLYELSFILKDSFQNYISKFKSIVSKIGDFSKHVQNDFRSLFKLDQYLKDIDEEVEKMAASTSRLIKQKTMNKIKQIQNNQRFYKKLQQFKYYSSIQSIAQRGLEVQIKNLLQDTYIKAKMQQIKNIVKQISESLQQFLEKLSETKQKTRYIKQSVQGKIAKIKISLLQIRKKFFHLQNLVFITLKGEITDVVIGNIRAISHNIDLIVTQDLASLGQLSVDEIGVSSIKQLVNQVIEKYNNLKQLKDTFLLQMENTLMLVDQFIQDHLSQKIQKLKDGAIYIKSLANLQQPPKSVTLYRKQFWKKTAPIAKYSQIIPTQIGTFLLGLTLNYSLSFEVLIELVKFRNINIGSNFSASLIIDITFGYGIANVLQFGLFVTGNLLRADVRPAFLITNAVPFQLVEAITGIQQLQKFNKIDVYFIVNLGLYAVQLTVGMYIKHIWLELIWTTIRICIKFLFAKFCISFRIPIGFKITFKRHDFGYKIPGVALAETRIINLHLLSLKY